MAVIRWQRVNESHLCTFSRPFDCNVLLLLFFWFFCLMRLHCGLVANAKRQPTGWGSDQATK